MEIEQTTFDYTTLDIEDREFVKSKELSIKARTSQTIWENGRDLLEVKDRLEHGQFMEWCEVNFPWGRSTIQNMMGVADKLPKFGNLDISKSVLYLLAAPSTPEPARQEAIERAEQGETLTHKQAQELIEAHKAIETRDKAIQAHEAHIEELEDTLSNMKAMLPTKNVTAEIAKLKNELEAEKNKPPEVIEKIVEKIPSSHEKLKKDNKFYLDQIKTMDGKINKMSTELQSYEGKQKEIEATRLISEAHKSLTKALVLLEGGPFINPEVIVNSLTVLESDIKKFQTNSTIMEANYNEIRQIS